MEIKYSNNIVFSLDDSYSLTTSQVLVCVQNMEKTALALIAPHLKLGTGKWEPKIQTVTW